jgi:hypothetical protein
LFTVVLEEAVEEDGKRDRACGHDDPDHPPALVQKARQHKGIIRLGAVD